MNADQNRFDTTLLPPDDLDVRADEIARLMVGGHKAKATGLLTEAQKAGLSVSAIVSRAQGLMARYQAKQP